MIILNKHKDKIPCGAIYGGRGSVYGNPFPIDKDNDRDIISGLKKLNKDSVLVCFHKNNSS